MMRPNVIFLAVCFSLLLADDVNAERRVIKSDVAMAAAAVLSGKSRGFFVGDFCDDEDQCSPGLPHTVCNAMTQRCECDPRFPIVVDSSQVCVPPLKLGERCLYDQSCSYFDRNAVCGQSDEERADPGATECRCKDQFQPSITLESIHATSICIPAPHGPWLKSDVPTVIGLGVGMSLFMGLTCLVLKLFSRARFAQEQARGYGNAHLPPPTHHHTNNSHHHAGHSEGKQHAPRRHPSITDSEATAPGDPQQQQQQHRRTNSISNGGGQHSRTGGSFHGRRQSGSERSPMRSHRETALMRDSGDARSSSSVEQLHHPLQP